MIETLLPTWPSLQAAERDTVARDVAAFVGAELRAAPFHIRLGLGVLATLFGLFIAIATGGRGLGRLADARRDALLARWEKLGGNAARSFLRAVRSLTLLAYFDHPAVLAELGAPAPRERQDDYRGLRAAGPKRTGS